MLYEKDLNSRLDCLHENRPKEEKAPRLLSTSDKNKNEQNKHNKQTQTTTTQRKQCERPLQSVIPVWPVWSGSPTNNVKGGVRQVAVR